MFTSYEKCGNFLHIFSVEKEEEVVITDDENDEEEVSRKNGRNHSHFHVENLFI